MANQMHPNSCRVNFIYSNDAVEKLEKIAIEEGVTLGTVIRRALHQQYLPHIPDRISERSHPSILPRIPKRRATPKIPQPVVPLDQSRPKERTAMDLPPIKVVHIACDSFTAHQEGDKIILEVTGATTPPALPPPQRFLQPRDVARLLQISDRTLRKLMTHKTNPIPFFRFGNNSPRFLEAEIWDWARQGESCAARRFYEKQREPEPIDPSLVFGWGGKNFKPKK